MSANHDHNSADCDSVLELIPDYVFGLTDPGQSRLVESNLATCAEAADQLADFQRLQAEMRASIPQIDPPAALGERLMAALDKPPQRVANPRVRRLRRSWIVASAAVLLLVITNLYWLARLNDLTRRENELEAQIASPGQSAFVLTSTSGLRWVRLPPSQQNADTSAFLMWNAESEIGLMYARGFPALAAGTTYQLWLTRGDEKISVGTFTVDADGKGALLFHSSQPIDKYTWARITAEPANGSQTPSDQVVVNGKLSG
ncbi:MAG TPA: anti-sigma factor [Aggregatilineales bacterium]|nr:anti-sigma factor [Aggregatilineales bacterium]